MSPSDKTDIVNWVMGQMTPAMVKSRRRNEDAHYRVKIWVLRDTRGWKGLRHWPRLSRVQRLLE